MKPYILVVEDEEAIATMIEYNLKNDGCEVSVCVDGQTALDSVNECIPDLIVLDWMLPVYDGIEVCKRLRENKNTQSIPVIMLTARGEESDKLQGLDSGADDYMIKPFSPKELIARIHAVLRRTRPVLEDKKLEFLGLIADMNSCQISYNDKTMSIGPTEFRLLTFFMEHPGQVFSREQLLDNVWGTDVYIDNRTVDVHIRRLRKALDGDGINMGSYIKTIRSVGYLLEKPE